MDTPLRVLLIEDSESDAALIIRQLKKADYAVTPERVETAAQMTAALEQQAWDCVIADYRLPQFDAPAALAVLQSTGLDLPFIVVSGTIGEETAVALMKAGAHDYLMKDKLARLAPAVKRELAEAQSRRERQRAEQRFQSLIEHAPDGIVLVTVDGKFKYASPSARRLFGYGPDEAINSDPLESTHPDDLPAVLTALNNLIQDPAQAPTLQYRFQHKDGSWRWIESTFSNLLAEPSVEAIVINFRDITERKQAEDALRQSEESISGGPDEYPDPVFITDDDGQFTFICPNVPAILGYSLEDLQALGNISSLVGGDPISLAELDTRGEIANLERVIVDRSGRQRTFLTTIKRVSIGRGTLLYTFHDITERKRADEALLASEAKFREMAEQMVDVLFVTDPQGLITYMSPSVARIIGWQPDEMTDRSFVEFLPNADVPVAVDEFRGMMELGSPVQHLDVSMIRKDGSAFSAELSVSILKKAEQITGTIGLIRDITERKQAEAALRQSEERFRALIENSSDVIAQVTGEGLILYESPAVTRVLGYQPAEMIGRNGFEFVHPDDRAAGQEVFGKLMQQPDIPVTTEFRYKRKDDTWCWVEATGTNLLTEPDVKALIINYHDVTEHKQAEEALRDKVVMLQALDDIGQATTTSLDLRSDASHLIG